MPARGLPESICGREQSRPDLALFTYLTHHSPHLGPVIINLTGVIGHICGNGGKGSKGLWQSCRQTGIQLIIINLLSQGKSPKAAAFLANLQRPPQNINMFSRTTSATPTCKRHSLTVTTRMEVFQWTCGRLMRACYLLQCRISPAAW